VGEDIHADLQYSCYGQSPLHHHFLHDTGALDDANDGDAATADVVGSTPTTRLDDDVLDPLRCSAPSN